MRTHVARATYTVYHPVKVCPGCSDVKTNLSTVIDSNNLLRFCSRQTLDLERHNKPIWFRNVFFFGNLPLIIYQLTANGKR